METPAPQPSQDEITADLQTNPRYALFFEGQHPDWVAAFVRDYAHRKWMLLHYYGDFATRQQAGRLTWFEDAAYERLWDIQQKKLFDLLCQWRAGQLDVPGLRTTYDFAEASARIEACRLVPPITPEEVDLYADFLAQASEYSEDVARESLYLLAHWQDYDAFREYEETWDTPDPQGEEMPPWYAFHNSRTGAGQLLTLPDVRGPVEKRYIQAYFDRRYAVVAAVGPNHPPPDRRSTHLPAGDDYRTLVLRFARQFEPGAFQRQLAAELQRDAERDTDCSDGLNDDLNYLRELTRDDDPLAPTVAMLAHPNWREGLRLTVDHARRDRVLAALPSAYEAYCQRETLRIAHPDREEHNPRAGFNEMLLDGREALGEPRDLDY